MAPGLHSKPVLRRGLSSIAAIVRETRDQDLAEVRLLLEEILLDGWNQDKATILLTEEE